MMGRLIAGALAWAIVVLPLSGQEQEPLTFSSGAELIVLHVTVKDRHGAYVSGLGQDAFLVYEDNRPQVIEFFNHEDAPVTAGLLIDSSGSMLLNRERVIAAATAFAEASNTRDELFALAFNERVTPALPPAERFTSDPNVLREALIRSVQAYGKTALFDAISHGLDYLDRGRQERKVLMVVSDGADNASRATYEEVLTRTQASNVVIYTVALIDPVERDSNPKLLKRIADGTGGEAFAPTRVSEIDGILRHIADDIRHGYTVGYISSNPARDGTFRRLRVSVRSPDPRQRLVIRTRGGYLAPRR